MKNTVSWDMLLVIWKEFTYISDEFAASIFRARLEG
jgi:hypothetical protein